MSASQRWVEAIIFDLDDTLIDWSRPSVSREQFYKPKIAAIHYSLTTLGHELPPVDEFFLLVDQAIMAVWAEAKKDWRITSFGDMLGRLLMELDLDLNEIDMDHLLRQLDWGPRPGVIPFPDTVPVLKVLRQMGYRLGLLTNSFMPMWVRDTELKAYQLLPYLDARISAADIGYLKPHPFIYLAMLETLQVSPERSVFVGDRPINDIAGANEAGLISVLMAPPHLNRLEESVVPDYTISCLSQLLPILAYLETDQGSREHPLEKNF